MICCKLFDEGWVMLDVDIYLLFGSLVVVCYVVGGVCDVVDVVLVGQDCNVFVVMCLFGYYVECVKVMGFCILNLIVIGVLWVLQYYGLDRVVVLDFDVYYGNGM